MNEQANPSRDASSAMAETLHVVICRYVASRQRQKHGAGSIVDEVGRFTTRMNKWGINVLKGDPSPEGSERTRYWDYPAYHTGTLPLSSVSSGLPKLDAGIVPIRCEYAWIQAPPEHIPFEYALTAVFAVKPTIPMLVRDPHDLRVLLGDATKQAKEYAEALTEGRLVPYAPTFWFLTGYPAPIRGLGGTANALTDLVHPNVYVERDFGVASYIVYGAKPDEVVSSLVDLALLSVVTHLCERHYRRELSAVRRRLLILQMMQCEQSPTGRQAAKRIASELGEVSDEERIAAVLATDGNDLATLTPGDQNRESFGRTAGNFQRIGDGVAAVARETVRFRSDLSRLQGLVRRVRQKHGAIVGQNVFDIICDDAATALEQEVAFALTEAEGAAQRLGERITQAFGQQAELTSQRLATIGQYIAAVAVAIACYEPTVNLLKTVDRLAAKAEHGERWLNAEGNGLAIAVAIVLALASWLLVRRFVTKPER